MPGPGWAQTIGTAIERLTDPNLKTLGEILRGVPDPESKIGAWRGPTLDAALLAAEQAPPVMRAPTLGDKLRDVVNSALGNVVEPDPVGYRQLRAPSARERVAESLRSVVGALVNNPAVKTVEMANSWITPEAGEVSLAGEVPPGFGAPVVLGGLFSRLERAALALPKTIKAQSLPNALAKAGATAEEMTYRKIDDLVRGAGSGSVTREQVVSHLEQNPLSLRSTVLADRAMPELQALERSENDVLSWLHENGHPQADGLDLWELRNGRPGSVGDAANNRALQARVARMRDAYNANEASLDAAYRAGRSRAPQYANFVTPGANQGTYREVLIGMNPTKPTIPPSVVEELAPGEFSIALPDGVGGPTGHVTKWESSGWAADGRPFPGESKAGGFLAQVGTNKRVFEDSESAIAWVTNNQQEAAVEFARGQYKSPHWTSDPNTMVHVRANDRVLPGGGGLGRYVEEIQSDWHQAGKQKGYRPVMTPERHAEQMTKYRSAMDAFRKAQAEESAARVAHEASTLRLNTAAANEFGFATPLDVPGGGPAVAVENRMRELIKSDSGYQATRDAYHEALARTNEADRVATEASASNVARENRAGVPDAPLKDSWPDLAIKQQLVDVAKDPNLEWIGFTPGKAQAERYRLSRVVDELEYNPKLGRLFGRKNGMVVVDRRIPNDELATFVGKDAAEKLRAAEVDGGGFAKIEGEALEVGGRGMRSFYDEALPAKLRKIVKPLGGVVERSMPALETQAQIRAKLDAVYAELDRMYRSPHVGSESPEYAAFARKRAALEAEQSNLADKLARAIEIGSDHPDNLPWIVRITPEMRAKLLKEGLPAMMVPLGAVVGGTRKQ